MSTTVSTSGSQSNAGRVSVRTSSGIPYVVQWTSGGDIQVFKGNGTNPTSFSEQDSSNKPSTSGYGAVSCAIDSSDIIHIAYMYDNAKYSELRYVTFITSSDSFSGNTTVISDLGEDPTTVTNLYSSIAIDSSDVPHIAYVGVEKNAGTIGQVVNYVNKVGGSWNSSVEVEGQTDNLDCIAPDIAIDADDVPVIGYLGSSSSYARFAFGSGNNATSFTLTSATTTSCSSVSLVINSDGDHYIFYKYTAVAGARYNYHSYGDSYSTLYGDSLITTLDFSTGTEISAVADGTDLYVFGSLNTTGTKYWYNTGSGWTAGGTLDSGTFTDVRAKWAFWVDNNSNSSILADSYSESNNSGSIGIGGGVTYSKVAQSFTGNGKVLDKIEVELNTNLSPTGNVYAVIYAHTGTFGSSGVPTGTPLATSDAIDITTITSTDLYEFIFSGAEKITLDDDTHYFLSIEYDGGTATTFLILRINFGDSHEGNMALYNGSSWLAESSDDFGFYVYTDKGPTPELDYTFNDGSGIEFNTLTLSTPASDLSIDIYNSISLEEDITIENSSLADIDIFDEQEIIEDSTISVEDALDFNIDVFDSVSLDEDVSILNEFLGNIDIFDEQISVEDITISVQGSLEVNINIFDDISLEENLILENILFATVIDTSSLEENITIENSELGSIDIYDDVTLEENIEGQTEGVDIQITDVEGGVEVEHGYIWGVKII